MPPPSPEGGGIYCFGADSVGVGVGVYFFVSVHYLLNQSMDLTKLAYKHCWEEAKSSLDFGDLTLFSRLQGHFEMSKKWFSCVIF